MKKLSPLIVALDLNSLEEVEKILTKLGTSVDYYKVGLRLFTHYGPDILKFLKRKKKKIFLDLKFFDIPNTVAEACQEATRHGVEMLTLHAGGGEAMMRGAVAATQEAAKNWKVTPPLLMAVTVLTSMDSLAEFGMDCSPLDQVLRLARMAESSGMDGVICSPHEIREIRAVTAKEFLIVTPGVRPPGMSADDQKRIKTPAEAFAMGANAVVVGRPILKAEKPRDVVRQILPHR